MTKPLKNDLETITNREIRENLSLNFLWENYSKHVLTDEITAVVHHSYVCIHGFLMTWLIGYWHNTLLFYTLQILANTLDFTTLESHWKHLRLTARLHKGGRVR